jgi:hypothetical protein
MRLRCAWPIPTIKAAKRTAAASEYRSIPLHFNVRCAQSDSPELITYVPTSEPTPTRDLLFALYVERLLLDSMTANDMRAYILARKSLSVRET